MFLKFHLIVVPLPICLCASTSKIVKNDCLKNCCIQDHQFFQITLFSFHCLKFYLTSYHKATIQKMLMQFQQR